MKALVAEAVRIVHILVILGALVIPFTNDPYWLQLYVIAIPFLWLHWITNDDTCALTLLESSLRGISNKDTFMHSLLSPIYKFQDQHAERRLWWIASYFLWAYATTKFYGRHTTM
jgi:hypothetical protein